ncbi:MAG: hypothetical protein IJ678_08080 [Kiritimatiellae bacterium]|nr:hypothetical protein [Kiritimatiellia bacterium]
MKTRKFTSIYAVAALVAALAAPASAGLRAWEPSDYVRDSSLAWHLDGIRNAGLGVAHNSAATTWADLSGNGRDAERGDSQATSVWKEDGFFFNKNAAFNTTESFTIGTEYTIEFLVDFKKSDLSANGYFLQMSGGNSDTRHNSGSVLYNNNQKAIFHRVDNLTGAAWDGVKFTDTASVSYFTVFRNGTDAAVVKDTTTHPSSWVTGTKNDPAESTTWRIGANTGGGGDQQLKGTIKSIRAYSRLLTDAELAWNRAVDDARFFGASVVAAEPVATAAVPDAYIASNVSGAEGAEANGCYVVDKDGYTFRAAPFAKVGTASYVCTGYTLAAWDGSAYGAAVAHDGEFACFVAPGDKVRIEWQWEAASGSLAANPYVTDGLVLHYDGIWNAGFGVHDSAATVWKDLSASGNDAEFVYLAPGGGWLDNAYSFETNGHFQTQSAIDLGTSFTVQTVTDHSGYVHQSNTWPWFLGSADAKFSVYPNSGKPHVVLNADGVIGGSHRSEFDWTNKRYLTAMMDCTSNVLFEASARDRAWSVGSGPTPLGSQEFTIGGPSTTASFSGSDSAEDKRRARSARTPYHAVRVYNRLLTDDELAHNRAIDEARFFGSGAPASNAVIVASSVAGLEGREPDGLYFPDGWTFAAGTATNTVRGIGWVCAGYQLQTWDAESGAWGAQTTVLRDGGNAIEYTSPAAPFASVRLTWLWRPVSGIRTAADYAIADYAASGVALHLDGIEHGSADWVWTDLSGNGRDATYNGSKNGTSHWTGDGFFCNSNAVFNTAAAFSLGRHYTMQVLAEASNADHTDPNRSAVFAMPSTGWGYGGIYYKGDGNKNVYHRTDSVTSAAWNDMAGLRETAHMTYLTGLRDGTKVALVSGTSYPDTTRTYTGEDANWYVTTGWLDGTRNDIAAAATWRIGASTAGGGADALYGTVKSVRLYDRMLTEDELAWNREVDNARFFGALATTNVVVVANAYSGGIAVDTDTAYRVYGTATFEPSTAEDGSRATQIRVRTLQPDGTWGDTRFVATASYTYDASTRDDVVQIEFREINPFVIIIR